jgi:peptidoglycan/LPS O-acetylase OafA/YrhL
MRDIAQRTTGDVMAGGGAVSVNDMNSNADRGSHQTFVRNATGSSSPGNRRVDWLDVLRLLTIVLIVGFHWVRTSEASNSYGLTWSEVYEWPERGLHQLYYLFPDRTGLSVSSLINNAISVLFQYGWQGVNVFVLLSGLGLAMNFHPERPGFELAKWYRRRFSRILAPYYVISVPMILIAELVMRAGSGQTGALGKMASKLAEKNLKDPLLIELAKNIFLVDPRQHLWITAFFSPAWWFIPPLLVAYLCFPLLHRIVVARGLRIVLPISLAVTAGSYTLTHRGMLWQWGWYFIILHELSTFIIGIAIGRFMSTERGRHTVLMFIAAPRALFLGAGLYVIGTVANWFPLTAPLSTPVFTLGLVLVLSYISVALARFRSAVSASQRVDGYHIYLMHQFIAFPLVAIVASALHQRARSIGYSTGLIGYFCLVFAVVFLFDFTWKKFIKRES